jgi:hypothetical protein
VWGRKSRLRDSAASTFADLDAKYVGSSKPKSGRVKIFDDDLSDDDEEVKKVSLTRTRMKRRMRMERRRMKRMKSLTTMNHPATQMATRRMERRPLQYEAKCVQQ